MVELANEWGTFVYSAAEKAQPRSLEQVVELVNRARQRGLRIKPIGGRHSFNAILGTSGIAVDLSVLNKVISIDPVAATAEVEAGASLGDVIVAVDAQGLHFPSLGSWHSQSVAGAISTSTHGSSMVHGSLSDIVLEVEAVLADGSVRRFTGGDELRAMRCHLGQLGIVTKVKLQLTPAFWLSCRHQQVPDDRGFAEIADRARNAEYVNMLWLPYLDQAVIRTLTRTPTRQRNQAALDLEHKFTGKSKFGHTREDLRNYALGHAYVRLPGLLAKRYSRAVREAFDEDDGVIDKSYRVFLYDQYREPTENRQLRLLMNAEYAVPVETVADVMAELKRVLVRHREDGVVINYPRIHVRFTPESDATLIGLNTDRDTAFIGIYIVASIRHGPQIPVAEAMERVFSQAGGRPHWGKYRYLSGDGYQATYSGLSAFRAIRDRLDPQGMFRDGADPFADLPRFEEPPSGRVRSVFSDPYREIRLL